MRLRPLLRPAVAFREEPSDRLVAAPWLFVFGGLGAVAAGAALDFDVVKAIGVIALFVGGGLVTAIQVRAAMRPESSSSDADDDSR